MLFGAGATAQNTSPILTIDRDRMINETRRGAAMMQALEAKANDLARENQQIEADLVAEEQELTEKRATLPPEEFRALANDFDERVQKLRAEQDEKAALFLNREREEVRNTFLRDSSNVVSEIARAKGALIVIDRRDVYISAEIIDITDEVIERLNAVNASE